MSRGVRHHASSRSAPRRLAHGLDLAGKLARPLLLTFLITALCIAADEWPQFRGNPQLTGVAPSAPPNTLKLLWTYEAGDSIESSAAIVDGTVYIGSQAADLLAVDLKTGKLRWKY